jgi:protein-disulfide isomerase
MMEKHLSWRQMGRVCAAISAAIAPAFLLAAAPASNWLNNYGISTDGGHIIGNPAATTKIVEYASYTCGHCANFETTDAPILKRDYIAKGKVSFEIRNLARDPVDLTVALLARCGGKGRFFGNHQYFMATQSQWMPKSKAISAATGAKIEKGDYTGFVVGAYREMGLGAFAKQRGITDAQAQLCLKDPAALKTILGMTDKAVGSLGIAGTPSFLINGKLQEGVHDMASMHPYLPK